MKLEKVVLNGFKSFADKTEFSFEHQITAIVGPNGCGKSNVVDAVKWVLGSQSPKQLRSGQMADVIFSGSSSRKPSGMAQVSLLFSDVRGLGLEQDELEISRRLYRSGESEYLMNGRPCRLRDIREMFMDTGIGVNAYSIIEQGQIDQLLSASKVDRRVIFEEAAGISRFKAQKKEALRKLDRTEQNLLRLADIVAEVQRQLRSVKLQAGKARNYLDYAERLKHLRVHFSLGEYDRIVHDRQEKRRLLDEVEACFGQVAAEVSRSDARLSEIGSQLLASETQINRWDNTLVAVTSKIDQQRERIGFLRHRTAEAMERKAQALEQIRALEQRRDRLGREAVEARRSLDEVSRRYEEQHGALKAIDEAVEEASRRLGGLRAELEDEKSGIIDIVRRTAQLHNEIQSMSTYRDTLSGQMSRLSDRAEAARAQLGELLTQKAHHEAKLRDIAAVLADLQAGLEAKRRQMEALDAELAVATDALAEAKERRSGLLSELAVLRDMEANREGLSEAIKDILERRGVDASDRFAYVDGIVADIIRADATHAAIVEAALEGQADALVVDSTGAFLADDEIRRSLDNRVTVICADRVEPFVETHDLSSCTGVLGRVVEFVQYDSRHARLAWSLLGHVIVVDALDTAMELSRRLGPRYRFVTSDGQVFDGRHGLRVGPVGKAAGLISRKSRIGDLERQLAAVTAEIESLESQRKTQCQQSERLTKLCKDLRTSIYEASTEKVDTESTLRVLDQDIQRLRRETPLLESEMETLEREIRQSVQREHDSKQRLEELEQINTERSARIEALTARVQEAQAEVESQSARRTELKVQIGQLAEQQRSLRQQIAALDSQLQHSRMTLESARTEVLACEQQAGQAEQSILASESAINTLYREKDEARRHSEDLHSEVDRLVEEQKQTEQRLRTARSEQAQVEQQMQALRVELGQLQVREEDLCGRAQEELGIDLAEAYRDFEQQDVDWDAVREEIAELRGKIDRLGNVNLDAIDQLEELEQRYEFLSSQVEDLEHSKNQLQQLIARIDKESREKFRVTFEEIRENFQQVFRKLFGGGKADILLEDPDDLLESGIEIIARPPGKETRSLSLLSGGEKTMTAISLLFAVFKTKPSPFCFLDEVDAALDEANNERFNRIVQEFKRTSQFIIITHAKRTMSIADVLYGVTMQTKGVSKKISVQFDTVETGPETETAVA